MVIGCIGAVPFYVSSEAVKTFETFQMSSSARYATHQLAYGNTLLEFTGTDPSQVQIEILLSAYLGVSPAAEYRQLEAYELNGIPVPVVMGDCAYGRWRWVITGLTYRPEYYDKYGNVASAKVSVTLKEYM